MAETLSWVTPLLLLPGVGLLLISTSARYQAIHEEIHKLLQERSPEARPCARHVLHRARILWIAMLSLYAASSLLATGGLVGALTLWWTNSVHWFSWLLTVTGVFCIALASVALIRESSISFAIIETHAREVESSKDQ